MVWLRLLALLFLLSVMGCQQEVTVVEIPAGTNPAPTPTQPTATIPPPIVIQPTANLPAFAPLPTNDPKMVISTETPLPQATATLENLASPTAIPLPTFTLPPNLVGTEGEHYWLSRPVAFGGVVWTNKVYPYGSTRGGQLRPHHGVEFDVASNTEILATSDGVVVVAGPDDALAYGPTTNFYGILVVIQHNFSHNGQPVFTLYGHLNQPLVAVGQNVTAGQVIGLSGATGVADGPHTHFEVRVGQNSYEATRNPLLWLLPFPDRGTITGRVIWPDGSLVYEAPVTLHRLDGDAPYAATTTYANESLNSDEFWNENFALDDIYAGLYEVVVKIGDKSFKVETWVYPRRTSFVEIIIQG